MTLLGRPGRGSPLASAQAHRLAPSARVADRPEPAEEVVAGKLVRFSDQGGHVVGSDRDVETGCEARDWCSARPDAPVGLGPPSHSMTGNEYVMGSIPSGRSVWAEVRFLQCRQQGLHRLELLRQLFDRGRLFLRLSGLDLFAELFDVGQIFRFKRGIICSWWNRSHRRNRCWH